MKKMIADAYKHADLALIEANSIKHELVKFALADLPDMEKAIACLTAAALQMQANACTIESEALTAAISDSSDGC